jgi:hypothetical protein
MTVAELIEKLRMFDAASEVLLSQSRSMFAPAVWVGFMDTSGIFDDAPDVQLVISPWERDT